MLPPDVLVVDDEIEIVRLLIEVLTEEGYAVGAANDGPNAIAAIRESPPALVLLDYSMPAMTGAEVLAYLRANGFADLPVIIMSASTRAEALLSSGATDFLVKPFQFDTLLERVELYVRQRRDQSATGVAEGGVE